MLNRKHMLSAAAALAMAPLTSKAVVVTFQFDMADFVFASASTGTFVSAAQYAGASVTGTRANPVVTVPIGTYIEYGLDAEITGAGQYGIAAFQTGVTNSTNSSTSTATVAPGPTVVNSFFSSNAAIGVADGFGGISANLGTAGSYVAGGTTSTRKINYGNGSFINLYNSQRIKPVTTSDASFTLSATNLTLAFQYLTKGTNGSSPTYSNTTFNPSTDTINPMPVLTVFYGNGSTTATTSVIGLGQFMVSLTTKAPVTYGPQLGSTITITYSVSGNAQPASTTFSPSSLGYGAIKGFHSSDTEIYGLEVLNRSGGALTSAQMAAVINDINFYGSGVTASQVTGIYSSLFPGYDVLLTSTGPAMTGTTYYLDLDFTDSADFDPATMGFTVAAIAAVPEPATMTFSILGAAGLLLRRRGHSTA